MAAIQPGRSTTGWPAVSCSTAPLSASSRLISWWPGDGSPADFAGTNHATLQGGAAANSPGLVSTAFGFDGTNAFVRVPDSLTLRPTNFTIEAWVGFSGLDSAGSGGAPIGDQYIVFRQNTRSGDFEGFDLSKTRIGGSDVFRFLVSSAAGQPIQINSSTSISTGVWYHVAAVRGPSFLQLYVNGVLERQTNISFPQDYGNFPLYFGTSGQAFWDQAAVTPATPAKLRTRWLPFMPRAALASAKRLPLRSNRKANPFRLAAVFRLPLAQLASERLTINGGSMADPLQAQPELR